MIVKGYLLNYFISFVDINIFSFTYYKDANDAIVVANSLHALNPQCIMHYYL